MKSLRSKILKNLSPLIGLKLTIARRADSMRVLHFGEILEFEDGSVGEFALHIQCPWRLEQSQKKITGSSDLWEPIKRKRGFKWSEWNYHKDGNWQDLQIQNLLIGYDERTKSAINSTEKLIVEKIDADDFGGLFLYFSDDVKLTLFPDGTKTEHWRFFSPKTEKRHFVVEN